MVCDFLDQVIKSTEAFALHSLAHSPETQGVMLWGHSSKPTESAQGTELRPPAYKPHYGDRYLGKFPRKQILSLSQAFKWLQPHKRLQARFLTYRDCVRWLMFIPVLGC